MTDKALNSDLTPATSDFIAYRASWVCPVDRPPIQNGFVGIQNGSIQTVDSFSKFSGLASLVTDLGDGAIIPGLINAHTHLEFSDLEKPLGQPGIKFTDWIRLIVKSRIDSNAAPTDNKHRAIVQGLNETVDSGVVAVGEIATMPFELKDYASKRQIATLCFLEQLGSDPATFSDKRLELENFLSAQTVGKTTGNASFEFGASAHAPYSCPPALVNQICDQAFSQDRIVAMHLAETLQEREFLEFQAGEFVELLKDFGAWNPAVSPVRSVLSILKKLSKGRSLVIHGNYLQPEELDFVSQHQARMTIVFCPRTHRFFGHDKYPLDQMRQRSIRVAIGTDSRASNPDLNLFEEMKLIAKSFPALPIEQILQMGTLNGAIGLGLNHRLGTLSPQKSAAFGFVAGPASDEHVNHWLLAEPTTCQRIL